MGFTNKSTSLGSRSKFFTRAIVAFSIVLLTYCGWTLLSAKTIRVGKFNAPRLTGWDEYSYGDSSKDQTQLRFTQKHQGTQISLWFIHWHVPAVSGEPSAFLSRLAATYQDTKKRMQQQGLDQKPKSTVTLSQATQFRGWPAYILQEDGEKFTRKRMDFVVNGEHYAILMAVTGEHSPESLVLADEAWQKLASSAYSLK